MSRIVSHDDEDLVGELGVDLALDVAVHDAGVDVEGDPLTHALLAGEPAHVGSEQVDVGLAKQRRNQLGLTLLANQGEPRKCLSRLLIVPSYIEKGLIVES